MTAITFGIEVHDIGFLPSLSLLSGFSLSEDRFNNNFMQFTRSKGIRLSEHDLVFYGRPINLRALHRAMFSRNGFESVRLINFSPKPHSRPRFVSGICARRVAHCWHALGFPPVASWDPGRPSWYGHVIAQRLQQLYNAVLRHFDQVYISSMVARLRSLQALG